ncbi:MAG: hypothetical protein PHN42_04520 [Bacilli bacterium]|nr:hypothetical protein [Bacilli bacterium]
MNNELSINNINTKFYVPLYPNKEDFISCLIVNIKIGTTFCISKRNNQIKEIDNIIKFMTEQNIYTLDPIPATEELIIIVNKILQGYQKSTWDEIKEEILTGLFNYVNKITIKKDDIQKNY